jgi:hypothetical protein
MASFIERDKKCENPANTVTWKIAAAVAAIPDEKPVPKERT